MPLWWNLVMLAAVLLGVVGIRGELRKPKLQRNQKKLAKSVFMTVGGAGLLIWSQTALAAIAAIASQFWVMVLAGAFLVLVGLAKQKAKHPGLKTQGKANIVVGLLIIGVAVYLFYLR